MHMIWHKGMHYMISTEAYDALCECGPDVAEGRMTGDEAVETILRAEGFAV